MNARSELLSALACADEKYISAATLAEKLGISSEAVSEAVKALEAEGFSINSETSKGYKLSKENNKLSADIILSHLTSKELGRNIKILDTLDSTNNEIKKFEIENAPHGTTVIADRQTAGRGRIGRSFVSPSGSGLYMSVLVRLKLDIRFAPMITSAAACAAAEAVEELCESKVMIKWVNDLYMNGKKICGILTEASLKPEMRKLDSAIIGIGINVRCIGDSFDNELKKIATSIEDETGLKLDRNTLCAKVLDRLDTYLCKISDRSFLEAYRSRELLTGNMITATAGSEKLMGEAIGIDDNANLIIKLQNGEIRHLGSGEASLCRLVK